MQRLIVNNLRNGAWNVSSGLDYIPAYYATVEEVVSVIMPAAPWRVSFTNHDRLRPETNFSSLLGIAETIKVAEQAGLNPEITHMKLQGHEQGSADEALAMITAATRRGRYTAADVYPYLAGASGLASLIVPTWALEGGRSAMVKRFADPVQREKIAREAERAMEARFGGASGVFVVDVSLPLTEVMKQRNVSAGEAVIQLLELAEMDAILKFGSEDDLVKILRYPATAIACDCGASLGSNVHPRYFGTFPRVLGSYVRERAVLSWEDALRKMTGLPATMIGLVDRGYLAPGMSADIAIFDPLKIADRATYESPTERPEGMRHVLVNGQLAVKDGKLTGDAGGRTLLRLPYMPNRPESHGERELRGAGTVSAPSMTKSGNQAHIYFHLSQGLGARVAQGRLRVVDNGGRVLLQTDTFGLLQSSDHWASFTGYAHALTQDARKAFAVVVDQADSDRPGTTKVYLLENGVAVYQGTLQRVSLH
jgi:hypothetical protein